MNAQRKLLLLVTLAASVAAPALAQTPAPAGAPGAAAIPDLSGIWWHPSLPNFEPLPTGPRPVTNLSRRKDTGQSNYGELVGDYKNPILQPWAAEVVRKKGELSKAGVTYQNPANQCWPEPLPFIYKNFALVLLQQPHEVTMLYEQDHEFRKVRMNEPHGKKSRPSYYGNSVGHYEGDTLVVDTVGIKPGHPFAMIDLFGTPYTEKLHVVERFRVISNEEGKEAVERNTKENWSPRGNIFREYRGKFLQLHITIEDEGVFTTPWSATVTYGLESDTLGETVCAENRFGFHSEGETAVPTARKPDF